MATLLIIPSSFYILLFLQFGNSRHCTPEWSLYMFTWWETEKITWIRFSPLLKTTEEFHFNTLISIALENCLHSTGINFPFPADAAKLSVPGMCDYPRGLYNFSICQVWRGNSWPTQKELRWAARALQEMARSSYHTAEGKSYTTWCISHDGKHSVSRGKYEAKFSRLIFCMIIFIGNTLRFIT